MSDTNPTFRTHALALVGTTILLVVLATGCGSTKEPNRRFATNTIKELSGLVPTKNGQGLYGVADNGVLVETDLEGTILKRLEFKNEDLEGITWGRDGELWLLSERTAKVFRVDPETFEKKGRFRLPIYPEREDDNKSYEGIAFDGKSRLYLVNERPAVLVTMEQKKKKWKIVEQTVLPARRVNDLMLLSDNRGFVLIARDRGLRLLDFECRAQGEWYGVQEINLEGLALVPGKGLFLASDQDPAVLVALENFKSEDDVWNILSEK